MSERFDPRHSPVLPVAGSRNTGTSSATAMGSLPLPQDVSLMPPTRDHDAVEVLTRAFAADPGYERICAPPDAGFPWRLRAALAALITLLRAAGAHVLGINHEGATVAVAVVLEPGHRLPTWATLRWIMEMWRGAGLRATWRAVRNAWACEAHRPDEPLHHLVLLGVDPGARGLGLARRLTDAVAATARSHPMSHGVCLETENPANVPFYQRLGYEVHARFRWDRLDVHALLLRTSGCSSTKPQTGEGRMMTAPPRGVRVVAAYLGLVAVVTTASWAAFFTLGNVQVRTDAAYLAFERAFPLADVWMSAYALAGGMVVGL